MIGNGEGEQLVSVEKYAQLKMIKENEEENEEDSSVKKN
jgi:hypothetical protein